MTDNAVLRTTARSRARALGHATYKGKICRHCEGLERYTSSGACATCVRREAHNKRQRERLARARGAVLPQKNSSARSRAAAKGLDRYKGLTCKQCSTRERWVDNSKCIACEKAGNTYYSRTKKIVVRDPRLRLLASAKARAAQFEREFNIELEDLVIPETCPVFGTPMESPSVDRFDNTLGYVKGNVRVISRRANVLKSNGTIEEFEAILRYMREA